MDAQSDIPSHRACAACRGQKVRCIPDESNPDVCQRCARSGRTCVFTPLMKRKQRKRTDTRVAELEKEMRAMRAALQKKNAAAASGRDSPTQKAHPLSQSDSQSPNSEDARQEGVVATRTGSSLVQEEDNFSNRNIQQAGPKLWPTAFYNGPVPETKDVVDSGMISVATARHLFETYRTDLFPHYPMVPIPEEITAEEMRATKPALFLSVIAAAAGKENTELSEALDKEVLQAYATRSLVRSEKSLELVQALLVSSVWYHPPQKFGQLKYYEYIHMAISMAMDIGIGTRQTQYRGRYPKRDSRPNAVHPAEDINNPDLSMAPRSRPSSPDTTSIEARRTFVACYIVAMGVSMSLRRPNTLRSNSFIRESVDMIEKFDAIPTDGTLVCWARLIMISEDISASWCYDDPGATASITELRTQLMMKDFEKRLTEWYTTLPPNKVGTGPMIIMYYTIRLYLFEVALHIDHSPEDFKAPYQMGGLEPYPEEGDVSTQVLAETIANCIESAHALLTFFLSMDVEGCRSLPVFSYVRISFAAFVLAKLCLSAAHPRSRIAKVIDRNSLQAESYMDRAILHVRNVVGVKRSRVPSIFLALLFKLRQWCLNPDIVDHFEDSNQVTGDISGFANQRLGTWEHIRPNAPDFEGQRITEHVSSNESSPQTTNRSSIGNVLGHHSGDSSSHGQDTTPNSQTDNIMQNSADLGASSGFMPVSAGMQPIFDPSMAAAPLNNMPWPDAGANMAMDPELLQFIATMNETSQGGLTGLDDWANDMPLEQMNWQMGNGTTMNMM